MRNMSFLLTTEQVKNRTKTVTRRTGWRNLKPGELIQAVVKGQGLKKGERVERLAVIRVIGVRSEPLRAMTAKEMRLAELSALLPLLESASARALVREAVGDVADSPSPSVWAFDRIVRAFGRELAERGAIEKGDGR